MGSEWRNLFKTDVIASEARQSSLLILYKYYETILDLLPDLSIIDGDIDEGQSS